MTEFNPLDMPIVEIDEATKAEKTSRFEASRFLDSPETISAFLADAMRDGDSEHLMEALGEVAKAIGINKISQDAGVNRESLYKTFKKGTRPRFETVMKVLDALGVELTVKPKQTAVQVSLDVVIPRYDLFSGTTVKIHKATGFIEEERTFYFHGNKDFAVSHYVLYPGISIGKISP